MRTTAPNPTFAPPEATLPPEWEAELQQLSPGSYERDTFLSTLGELGLLTPAEASPATPAEDLGPAPAGFTEWRIADGMSRLPVAQFAGRLVALHTSEEEISTAVTELASDTGKMVRVCDLRPYMTGSVQKLAPRTPAEQVKLDLAFYRDIKGYTDTGTIRNRVTEASRAMFYSRAWNTSMRAFWTLVTDIENPSGTPSTIARLSDSGNNKGFEIQMYRRLFGYPLRIE